MFDPYGELTTLTLQKAARQTTTPVKGSAIDLMGYDGILRVMLSADAAAAGTNPTLDVKIQESVDTTDGNFSDISGKAFTQVTTVASAQTLSIDVRATKRYIRAYIALGGTNTPTFDLAVIAVGRKQYT